MTGVSSTDANNSIATELVAIANAERVPALVRRQLMEIATRMQSDWALKEMVKFADGTHGCHTCGARPGNDGQMEHHARFHDEA